jgi:hypothetical protein
MNVWGPSIRKDRLSLVLKRFPVAYNWSHNIYAGEEKKKWQVGFRGASTSGLFEGEMLHEMDRVLS